MTFVRLICTMSLVIYGDQNNIALWAFLSWAYYFEYTVEMLERKKKAIYELTWNRQMLTDSLFFIPYLTQINFLKSHERPFKNSPVLNYLNPRYAFICFLGHYPVGGPEAQTASWFCGYVMFHSRIRHWFVKDDLMWLEEEACQQAFL